MRYLGIIITAGWMTLSGGYLHAEQTESLPNAICPVDTDEQSEPGISVEYNGESVHFCCRRCRQKFLDDPSAYVSNLPQFSNPESAAPSGHGERGQAHVAETAGSHQEAGESTHADGQVQTGDEPDGHDHARDHGETPTSTTERAAQFLGKFHPLVVHFPIALILTACLAELIAWVRPESAGAVIARFSINLGAASAVIAAPMGWLAASFANYSDELAQTLFFHRWSGVSVAVLSLAAAVLARMSRANPRFAAAYRSVLFAAGAAVVLAGHFGASLIYGTNYFTW